MPAYDEALTQQILFALQEAFPNKVSSHDLKARLRVQLPESQWMLALDALYTLRLIHGKVLRDGSTLVAAANLEITPRGRRSLSTAVTRGAPTNQDVNNGSTILVTTEGECFDAQFLNVGHAGGRDGFLQFFKITDRLTDNRERTVSMFLSGTDRALIQNYLERLDSVRLNVLRRAFDSGIFNFETTINPNVFPELPLRATDFMAQRKADDDKVRNFIKFGAYYLGFRFAPSGPNPHVDFDCPEDLEYLGITAEDVHRNVRYLTQKGYLVASSAATYANPSRCSPTDKLIDEIEQGHVESPQLIGANVTQHNYHLNGHNSRINVNSTDNSVNTTSVSNDQMFVQMRQAAEAISDESARATIISRLDALENAKGTTGFLPAYQKFMASIADHITVFSLFLPALAQLLTSLTSSSG
jgi:hypothetical protein